MTHNCVEQRCEICGIRLGLDVSPIKKYCNKCRKEKDRESNRVKCARNYYKRKLRKTYDFLKISIIQSPYFIEQNKIEIKLRNQLT